MYVYHPSLGFTPCRDPIYILAIANCAIHIDPSVYSVLVSVHQALLLQYQNAMCECILYAVFSSGGMHRCRMMYIVSLATCVPQTVALECSVICHNYIETTVFRNVVMQV